MAKSRDAFRTISEVSDVLETPAHVLRFWESKFSQIKPVKRAGGRRYYRPDDVSLLAGIKHLLHDQGMTIKGAQKLLREKGVKHVVGIGQGLDGPLETMPQSHVEVPPEAAAKAVSEILKAEDESQTEMFTAPVAATTPEEQAKPKLQIISAKRAPDTPAEPVASNEQPADDFEELEIPSASPAPDPSAKADTQTADPITALSSLAKPKVDLPANPMPRSDLPARCLASVVHAKPQRVAANAAKIAPLLDQLTKLRDEMRHPW